jgi:acetyl esterase/lipase
MAPNYTTHTYAGDLKLDVFAPEGTSQRCCVLVLHGGGWRVGDRADVHDRCLALARHGLTAVAVQYRLLDASPWPGALHDIASAIRWARENAERLDVEPTSVVVQGHSAGGHIALMLGTLPQEQRPAAIAAFYPGIGFHEVEPPAADIFPPVLELDDLGRAPSHMLFPPGTPPEQLRAASPIDLLDDRFPATLILHGSADSVINERSSVALHRALLELGVPSDLHIYAGLDHEFDRSPTMMAATSAATALFIRRFVTHPEEALLDSQRFGFPPGPSSD